MKDWRKELDKIVKNVCGFFSVLFKREQEEHRPDGYHLIILEE